MINLKKKPLWVIKRKMKQLQLEIALLAKDPSTNHDEIAARDAELSALKLEYAKRISRLVEAKIGRRAVD